MPWEKREEKKNENDVEKCLASTSVIYVYEVTVGRDFEI